MQSAVEFLETIHPQDMWTITAIPEHGDTTTKTFLSNQGPECQKFIDKYNGTQNLYFQHNPAILPAIKKLSRQDIKSVKYLHVDIDPPKGQPYDPAFANSALPQLMENRPKEIPEPTLIVFSGGGLQAFWKLEEPLKINGSLKAAEEAKKYNQYIEKRYDADNCHNIDRLMRLPFTTNVPSTKKAKQGRVSTEALVLEYNESAVYKITDFKKLVGPKTASPFLGSDAPPAPIDVKRIDDLSEVKGKNGALSVKLIKVIQQGKDTDDPLKGDNSRSAWVFYYCMQMCRLKIDTDVIFSILTDPKYDISDSILELGPKASWAAMRQIERARIKSIDPKLLELNDRHFVVLNRGGNCDTCEELYNDALKRNALTYQSFGNFKNRYLNEKIKIGETREGEAKYESLGSWWLRHPDRRQYTTVVFAPEKNVEGCYNLWQGFSVEAAVGECQLYLTHIKNNICCGNEEHYDYLVKWMAMCVQKPANPGQVAIVLRGEKGTGKGIFATTFGKLFGRHFMPISNPAHLVGNFNSHLRDCLVLFGDEAFFAGDKKHESVLKTLITESIMPIEAKGVDVVSCPNYVHLILAANDEHVVPASGAERRYFVLDVGVDQMQDSTYFEAIREQMECGGLEALLYFLKNVDLNGFNVRTVPQTDALNQQKELTLSHTQKWWYDCLKNGRVVEGDDAWETDSSDKYEVSKAGAAYELFHKHGVGGGKYNRQTLTGLVNFIKDIAPGMEMKQLRKETHEYDDQGVQLTGDKKMKRSYYFILPDLQVCRDAWEKKYPGLNDWPEQQKEMF